MSSTLHIRTAQGRVDAIQYEAPPTDTFTWYRGMIQTTTLEALPRTLTMIDARLAEDRRKFSAQASALSATGQAQAQHTLHWLDKELTPHLAEWRKLLR